MNDTTPENAAHVLDARKIDGEPFGAIMDALDDLPSDESLLLVNSFEPVPLYSVLEEQGFGHESAQVDDETWHVVIQHE